MESTTASVRETTQPKAVRTPDTHTRNHRIHVSTIMVETQSYNQRVQSHDTIQSHHVVRGRPVAETMGPPILTLADLEEKLERAAHVALTVLSHVMRSDRNDSTRVRAAHVVLDNYFRTKKGFGDS